MQKKDRQQGAKKEAVLPVNVLICGDLHMKYELPYASSIKDGRKSEWESVKKTIHESATKCDTVVLLGDQLNLRHNHSSVLKEFIDFLNGFGEKEIHILCGNHERYSVSTALDFLKSFNKKNWNVYTEPTLVNIGNKTAMMIPYMTPSLVGANNLEEGSVMLMKKIKKADLSFSHMAISGAKSSEFFNEIMLDKKVISKLFKLSYAGHLHKYEKLEENVFIVGSAFTKEVGENEKSLFILDTEKMKHEKISLPVRGLYKLDSENNPPETFCDVPTHSIVKYIVTKKGIDTEFIKKALERFDASMIIEQYEGEREKIDFEEGAIDLSVDSLLKLYADAKKIQYTDLLDGFNLIK